MHSRIFQVSSKPISKNDYISEDEALNDRLMDYCKEDTDREESIEWLIAILPDGAFSYDGQALTLLDIQPLLDSWQKKIDIANQKQKEAGIRDHMARCRVLDAIQHPLGDFLFYIEEWNGPCTARSNDFVEWVSSQLKPGDKIYIGAVLDYHF